MRKKIVSLLLAGIMVFSGGSTVLAGNIENQEVTGNTQSEVQVSLEIDATYSISIPKTIQLDKTTKSAEYQVSVTGTISDLQYISVVPDSEFIMTDGLNEVTATVLQEQTEWNASDISGDEGATASGVVSAADIIVGKWSGAFTFNIGINDKRFPIIAVDEAGTDLNATGLYIVGTEKATLLRTLMEAGMLSDLADVGAVIDVQADAFTGIAQAAFDVGAFAQSGDVIALYHYDETKGWENIGLTHVTEEGTATGGFASFGPVVLVMDKDHVHVDVNGDNKCDDCAATTDVHVHVWAEGICSGCTKACVHADENDDSICDICSKVLCVHTDINGDGKCDNCNADTDCHVHVYADGKCSGCGSSCVHVDSNSDYTCDVCSGYTGTYAYMMSSGGTHTYSSGSSFNLCDGEYFLGVCSTDSTIYENLGYLTSIRFVDYNTALGHTPGQENCWSVGDGVVAWYSSDTIYVGPTEKGTKIRLNSDSSYLFHSLGKYKNSASISGLEKLDWSCVEGSSRMFWATNITSIDLSGCNLKTIGYCFTGGTHNGNDDSTIRSIILPDTVETVNYGAFSDNSALSSVTYKGVKYYNASSLQSALEANGVVITGNDGKLSSW